MEFNNLKEKCYYYRDLTDYKLMPNSYVICMVDGRAFSHYIKKKFQLPFDDEFINMMNESAKYVCENVSGCRFAYTQSDEVSFLITDFHKENECIVKEASFFGYRLCKMQSIIASLMTAKFNQLISIKALEHSKINAYKRTPEEILNDVGLVQFDCKCWTVPNANDVYAWFLFRQLDCIRNSKQAVAQSVCSHKMLEGKILMNKLNLLNKMVPIGMILMMARNLEDLFIVPKKLLLMMITYHIQETLSKCILEMN